MAQKTISLTIESVTVQLIRKSIKSLRLTVYPPDGRVRLSVPTRASSEQIHSFLLSRLRWIKKQQAYFLARPHVPELKIRTGEFIVVFGVSYPLKVIERYGQHELIIQDDCALLFIRKGTTRKNRLRVLTEWYRAQLKQCIPDLIGKYQPIIGVQVDRFGVKNMKSRWGSCNIGKERIWLNLQLAKRPLKCLEYVIVHELIHLLERYHNTRFYDLLDQFLPDWQEHRALLNNDSLRL